MEEKQWVALDMLVNREQYDSLPVVEREELLLNDEYETELRAEDVIRILKLPHEIQRSLPHLESPTEVDAHRLLVTYTHELSDADFARADAQRQDVRRNDAIDSQTTFNDSQDQMRQSPGRAPSATPLSKNRLVFFESMSDVGAKRPGFEDDCVMAIRVEAREVYRSSPGLLKPQESHSHRFTVEDIEPIYSVDLKASIVSILHTLRCANARPIDTEVSA